MNPVTELLLGIGAWIIATILVGSIMEGLLARQQQKAKTNGSSQT